MSASGDEKMSVSINSVETVLNDQLNDLIGILGRDKFELLQELDRALDEIPAAKKRNKVYKVLKKVLKETSFGKDFGHAEYLGKKDAENEEIALKDFLLSIDKKFYSLNKYDIKRYAYTKDAISSKNAAVAIFSVMGDIEYVLNLSRQIGIVMTINHLFRDKISILNELKNYQSSTFKVIAEHYASLAGMIQKQKSNKNSLYFSALHDFQDYIKEKLNISMNAVRFKDAKKFCDEYNNNNVFSIFSKELNKKIAHPKIYQIKQEINSKMVEIENQQKKITYENTSHKKEIENDIKRIHGEIAVLKKEIDDVKHGLVIKYGLSPNVLFKYCKKIYKNRSFS